MAKPPVPVVGVEQRSLELLKGTLSVLILKTVSRGPLYGYAISRCLRENSGEAFKVGEGALYPALKGLEKEGWLSSEWRTTETGRTACFYRLTKQGEAELHRQLREWRRYVNAMTVVLGPADLPEAAV